ncbi:MAG: AbrB/MazE/SpoVT family DNA-binding domain-containing protein [Pseudomonadota bacterium]
MDNVIVTSKGQVVIPAKYRRKFNIKKGTHLSLFERKGELILKPITDDFIRAMSGITGTQGRLLKALKKEKAREKKL